MRDLIALADYFGMSMGHLAGRTDKRKVNR